MDLGKVVKLDIETRFKPHVIKEVYQSIAAEYQESIQTNNRKSVDPDGAAREELSDHSPYFYARTKMQMVGNDEPNLILSGDAESNLGIFNTDTGFEMYHTDARIDKYMNYHETGTGGMPQRRQFPTTQDSNQANQSDNVRFVEKQLEIHLNKPRKIIVNG